MDGPDLSHLLDEANPVKPSREVLDGIVRRHRRQQARRARTAATLGLVIVLVGAGVGIGVSRHSGTTVTALRKSPSQSAPSFGRMSATAPAPMSPGGAPEGLGWVNTGTKAGSSASVVSPVTAVAQGTPSSGRLQATPSFASSGTSLCSIWNCSLYSPYGSIGGVVIRHLFTRTVGGVSVRAFTAAFVMAPLELVPAASAPVSTPVATGTGRSPSVPTSSVRAAPVSCALTRALVVEVSDTGAVGVVTVPLGPSLAQPIDVLSDQVVGVAEGSPIVVVVAHTTGQAARVRAEFAGGGNDVMTVVDRWAVLVHAQATAKVGGTGGQGSATPGQATVYALSGADSDLEHADLPGSGSLAMAVGACSGTQGGVSRAVGSSASGSPGSASSGGSGSQSSPRPAPSAKPIGG